MVDLDKPLGALEIEGEGQPLSPAPKAASIPTRGFWDAVWGPDTGPGAVEEYLDHPLNFNKSRWLARLIRGLTGWFGSLEKALVDVILALIEAAFVRRGVPGGGGSNPGA